MRRTVFNEDHEAFRETIRAFIAGGYALGARWHEVTDVVGLYSKVILTAVAVAALAFVAARLLRAGRGTRRRTAGPGSGRRALERDERY